MADTILQHPILTNFAYPFLIVFFIVFAVLEKTKLFGDGKRQLNALLSFVIGLLFVSAVFPKQVVANMILFLSVAIVIVFVILILWGFVFSNEKGIEISKGVKWALFAVLTIAIIVAILWATGVSSKAVDLMFGQSWSEAFWTNFIFIILIVLALVVVIKNAGGQK